MSRKSSISKASRVPKGPRQGPQKGPPTMALIDLPFVQHRRWGGKDHYRYRRRIPPALQQELGKTELVRPLGKTASEAMGRYPAVHREAEALLLRRPMRTAAELPPTPAELHRWAIAHVRELRLDRGDGGPH